MAVLRKHHNTRQDLGYGASVKNHVEPGGTQQIEACRQTSLSKEILQARSSPLL